MEHVVSWIAGADETTMLEALGAALGSQFLDLQALTAHLLARKSYAPTHESVALALMDNASCRARAAQLLNALCQILRSPEDANTPIFVRSSTDSAAAMFVFRFVPP
jgi:hypothetical protein